MNPPLSSIATKVASPPRSACSVAASLGLIKSRNLSPSSEILLAPQELKKITLDKSRI